MIKADTLEQCQLYKYNSEFYLINRESPLFFKEHFHISEIDADYVSWLNYHGLKDRDNIETLCKNLGIEKQNIENIYLPSRRPKVEEYSNYMFFSIKSALPSEKTESLLLQENISFIVSKNYLISFQDQSSDHFTDVRDRIEKARGKIRTKKVDFLLFRLLEAIIDNYFEVIENISDKIAELDSIVLKKNRRNILKEIEIEKRKLIELRKITQPMRDITYQLEFNESSFIEKSNKIYFKNLKDACLTVLDEIDANKQILDGMANLYYAAQGQRMNEIMKVLTVVSSIFIPLTFIVGVYGMNFKHMPELEYTYGYYTVVGVMFLIGISLLAYFISRGWLKKDF
ncbi:MAG: magnesium/cobalt transporter CorA [Bacteroidota bacterium]